jgi:hypothetical protein
VKLVGVASRGQTITIYDQSALLGAVKSGGDGVWLFTTPSLTEGNHSITARATSPQANSSAPSPAINIIVRSVATSTAGEAKTSDMISISSH